MSNLVVRVVNPCVCFLFLVLLQKCHKCGEDFQPNDTKHHCRACGEGFCDACSSKTRPVPERGWGLAPVRVCDACFHNREISTGILAREFEFLA